MRQSKIDLPVYQVRRLLEPGPIVLVSSCWRGEINIMTLGWHTVMEFEPSLVGCVIANTNHSFELIRRSKECVINVPTRNLVDAVVGIGNSSGSAINKFETFRLTPDPAHKVKAPLIRQCHANLECKLVDARLVQKYNFFIFEVVKVHISPSPRHPLTLHYLGGGLFMVSGPIISRRARFRSELLQEG
jgi:flavin reductase (DIM6/NTAB) family NADH-FMN oxidoreductase RutF